ncbi:phytochelatin synthase [Desulfosarcina ovata]|uniref:glutathione gamma-glutamylcysteinyltransferase n=1 Tax=Desulfosarcina ovata subsp. ovata TaxID=2752305 RepID=A0A5K8AG25_9BACT|nr:phytochelatin synthase [Desulfosarcina ovata]BBO91459.1 hypothetical protein DSCOOX_46390 [Desulfosarcina ovata subsp. ovata]
MNLLRHLVRPYLYTRYGFHRLTASGSFRKGGVKYVDPSISPWWNPLKQAIWKHHVKQFHGSSCSVASVVACINALRSLGANGIRPITQAEILDQVPTGHWKQRMSSGGYHGRRGLPLPLLGQVIKDSIAIYGLTAGHVDIVPTPKNTPHQSPLRTLLKKRLIDFDRHGRGLLIAHFDQGSLIPTLNIPHISPVGAYDAKTDRVTMLDVDPDETRPYQVGFETFFNGLSTDYHHMFKMHGYGSGGYVYVALR